MPSEDRATQATRIARELLDADGPEAVSMRNIADRMGVKAPSLYKHVPDKATLEVALIVQGLAELGAAVNAVAGQGLRPLADAYREWALAHPHLYALCTQRPLPRDRLPEGLEANAAAPVLAAVGGDQDRARALWAAAHGLVSLELAQRFPPGADVDAAWATMVAAFSTA